MKGEIFVQLLNIGAVTTSTPIAVEGCLCVLANHEYT